ncbi:LysR family transcriptional regulator [Kordiimonas sediminis]|uniref:LysR family transcriptional regulator n=1 Tax=Kordiimonas sediminis TaxID=1735581 RepID=A0A919AQ82_9PROT|nr:LysR family transcriptional regulator [Kordiimonas sediminis]GHF19218.1 LysR family transcriptional regulator [Kordiimonas sediminis]
MKAWDDYQFILSLARTGTLRGAAKLMGVNHSTVSRRIQALNDAYNHNVFEQVAGGYQATQTGEILVKAAEKMEALAEETNHLISTQDMHHQGGIDVSLPEAYADYLLADDISAFCRTYPDIKLRIDSSFTLVDLDKSEADVVIRGSDTPPDHLVGRRLFPYAIGFYSTDAYLRTAPEEDRCWVGGMDEKWHRELLALSPYPNHPLQLQLKDITARHRIVARGFGMYVGPCFLGDTDPTVRRLPGTKPLLQQDLWILTHPDLRTSPRIKTLISFLTKALLEKKDIIQGTNTPAAVPNDNSVPL